MRVNGRAVPFDVQTAEIATERLLDTLRDRLGLTGAKEGCGVGECGACAVLLDGAPVCSCLVLTGQVDDREVVTVEGLGERGHRDLQAAFVSHQAVQCGYCIPGVLIACAALLEQQPDPDATDVSTAVSGNLCRCTGYGRFVDAVRATAADRRRAGAAIGAAGPAGPAGSAGTPAASE